MGVTVNPEELGSTNRSHWSSGSDSHGKHTHDKQVKEERISCVILITFC